MVLWLLQHLDWEITYSKQSLLGVILKSLSNLFDEQNKVLWKCLFWCVKHKRAPLIFWCWEVHTPCSQNLIYLMSRINFKGSSQTWESSSDVLMLESSHTLFAKPESLPTQRFNFMVFIGERLAFEHEWCSHVNHWLWPGLNMVISI